MTLRDRADPRRGAKLTRGARVRRGLLRIRHAILTVGVVIHACGPPTRAQATLQATIPQGAHDSRQLFFTLKGKLWPQREKKQSDLVRTPQSSFHVGNPICRSVLHMIHKTASM